MVGYHSEAWQLLKLIRLVLRLVRREVRRRWVLDRVGPREYLTIGWLSQDIFASLSHEDVQTIDHTSRGRWLGNGLGLTIARRILNTHSGSLIIANTGKPGACIRAGVPIVAAPTSRTA